MAIIPRKNPPRKAKTVAASRLSTSPKSKSSKRIASSRSTPTKTVVTPEMTKSRAASTAIPTPETPIAKGEHEPFTPTAATKRGTPEATSINLANTSAFRLPQSPPPDLDRSQLQALCFPTPKSPPPATQDYSLARQGYSPTYSYCDPSNPRYDPADPLLASPWRTHGAASSAVYDPASPRFSPTSLPPRPQRERGTQRIFQPHEDADEDMSSPT
ncbi:DNA-directed RNA polymerase II subunit RPB1 [Lasiodiplodia hormozganensis]|uniref:DNA-directed RNA polymerase II subunit RPB1 n=1 Tax=Lasiodiplodia hormozganensis TaxID=869390 RepID=A0AA40D2T6_9PEZI|nr:DNA-directed RNA polymerase II subunit RPB1 [Lasiodiplodia hormozganensis]